MWVIGGHDDPAGHFSGRFDGGNSHSGFDISWPLLLSGIRFRPAVAAASLFIDRG